MIRKLLLLATLQLSLFADWTFVNKLDDFDDKEIKSALWKGQDIQIQLSRYKDDVWIYFILKNGSQFDYNGIIEMRVDNNDIRKIDFSTQREINNIGIGNFFEWKPSVVAAKLILLTNGCGYIGELLHGQVLKIRYAKAFSMERNTFEIPLDKDAYLKITKGLEVDKCID